MKNAYLHLGVSENATFDEVERAYKIKTRLYDPSRFQVNTPEWEDAKEMRSVIEDAYRYISSFFAKPQPVPIEETKSQNVQSEQYVDSIDKPRTQPSNRWIAFSIGLLAIAILCLAGVLLFKREHDSETVSNMSNVIKEEPARTNVNPEFDYSDLVERTLPSIVRINTNKSTGSGFFVSDAGDILTNYHVIEGAQDIVVVPYKGGSSHALVKDIDSDNDMALITIGRIMITPFLRISNSLPKQGEPVIAIGNPKGLDGTVSSGIISAFRKNNTLVQFTAPVSPGSSGGALINLRGEVVGMPTMLLREGQNLNFAIAPSVLTNFFEHAKYKTPREMPKTDYRSSEPSSSHSEDKLLFVQRDKSYEIYLDTEYIEYEKEKSLVTFITAWYPSEVVKENIAKDPNFNLIEGKELGVFLLLYTVNLSNNTYVHLRTVNCYVDGTVARDYTTHNSKIKWETLENGGRISNIVMVLRRYLFGKSEDDASVQPNSPVTHSDRGKDQYWLRINKGTYTLYLYRGQNIVKSYSIAVGENPGNKRYVGDKRTPTGNFRVASIEDSSKWKHDFGDGRGKIAGAYGSWFIRLDTKGWKGIGIHGTYDTSSLGTMSTEGSISMSNKDILELRPYIYPDMRVVIEE